MSKVKRFLYRDAIRHAAASAAAAIVTAAIIFLGLATGALDDEPALTSLFVTLFFGLYGPIFLLLSWLVFRDLEGAQLRSHLTRTVEHSRLLRWLLLSSPASWASTVLMIGVISVVLLTTGDGNNSLWIIPICIVGVAGSWVLMVGVMAVEYMRSWANVDSMTFPGAEERVFADFIYLSVQLSTTFSSSDVALTRRSIRGLASLHSVLAFAYSTAIIAVFASLLITLTA
ncbi:MULTISPECIES: DUF1345 domain-containing protein [unclassified Microbacterium]|uniref:DUF1345 domain-containing protein n=1 Tax=unclassified Microbacterium TaxID=2609290 RepID=UPI000EA9B296|nr:MULTISPECIES: DUF1345 domain-containing protein [unclassified Microbacterium]MBT2486176.1 DUF1345 domain-containing protein [Microbacterium sp. ISL-108]RKN68902.1 DUF1345 domain-containing protein [Microbacterium sp. CGR2]